MWIIAGMPLENLHVAIIIFDPDTFTIHVLPAKLLGQQEVA